jgi:hypothetical protein
MPRFELTEARMNQIEEELDDTAGYLVKSSTLKFLIEREVNAVLDELHNEGD